MSPSLRTTQRLALAFGALLLLITLLEWFAAAAAYRSTITPDDWSQLRGHLHGLPDDEPVLLADPWLSPRGRLELPALRHSGSYAPPDLYGLPRFHILSRRSRDPWTPELRLEWGDLAPLPPATARLELPAFTLYTFTPPHTPELRLDLTREAQRLQVHDRHGPCRRRGDTWRCKSGELQIATVEIDHRPRRALCLDLHDGARVQLSLPLPPDTDHLRGHVGFTDFNARLRSQSPLRLTATLHDRSYPSLLFTDPQGWAAFSIDFRKNALDPQSAGDPPTGAPARQQLTIELESAVGGTWRDTTSYRSEPRLRPCVELRAFAPPLSR